VARLFFLSITVAFLLVSTSLGQTNTLSEEQKILHALSRLTFGPRPGDVEQVRRVGLKQWMDSQLHPERISENPVLEARLKLLPSIDQSWEQLMRGYTADMMMTVSPLGTIASVRRVPGIALDEGEERLLKSGSAEEIVSLLGRLDPSKQRLAAGLVPDAILARTEVRRAVMRIVTPSAIPAADLHDAKIYRALYSSRQLEEVLVDFWFNHFNVQESKGNIRYVIAGYERDAIRPHVLGKFKDMLLATAAHPAMLFYLDNWLSSAPEMANPNSPNETFVFMGSSKGLNENYGRELLELHTLGVDGGYTQADVIAAARSFAGWSVRSVSEPVYRFHFAAHHNSEKVFLGKRLPADETDGVAVLDIVAHHPSTARYISKRLAQRFVSDQPSQPLIDRMARTFTETDGDLRAVMETMLSSPEFFSVDAWQSKLKSPLEVVISSVRALGAETLDATELVATIGAMGQPLYNKLEPTGYPNTADGWLSTADLLNRIRFAGALAGGRVRGVHTDPSRFAGKDVAAMARDLLGRDASPETLKSISQEVVTNGAGPASITALVLASPEFQRR